MHFVYIIYSRTRDSFYTGETAYLDNRIKEHNQGKYKGARTAGVSDWVLRKTIGVESRSEALIIEQYIKKMKSKKFIHKLIESQAFYEGFKKIVQENFSISISE